MDVYKAVFVSKILFTVQIQIWFELSRVKLYRKDLKGNINYSELAGSSSYRGFELPRVKLQ